MTFNSPKFSSLKGEHLITAGIYVSAAVNSEEPEFLAGDSSPISLALRRESLPLHVLSFCLVDGP